MIETTETILSSSNHHPLQPSIPTRLLAVVVLISLLVGGVGGFLGAEWQSKVATDKQSVNEADGQVKKNGNEDRQTLTVQEDTAVVDVVKKASQSVVSIVVSKDVSKLSGFNSDPSYLDPFYQFFGLPRQRQDVPSKPNIQQVSAGSGFFVSKDGLVLTNKHVVNDESASYTVVTSDKRTLEAKVVARDPVNDLAILKVDLTDASVLELADSSKLEAGQRVVAIGYSLGQYQNTVTTGVVSGIGRSIVAGSFGGESEQLEGVVQTDAAINPGNSGGPLLNIAGQVIGINTAIDLEGQLIGFAIPSNDAKLALESFKKNGQIKRAYLGVRYMLINKELASLQKLPRGFGALIVRGDKATDFAVQPGSPADKAGLVENDIVLEVNGKEIGEDLSLVRALREFASGDSVKLKIYHRGEEKDVSVVLGEDM